MRRGPHEHGSSVQTRGGERKGCNHAKGGGKKEKKF